MALSALRGGNFRALLLVARSALVWAAELALWYGGDGGSGGGQPWGAWAPLAVVGYGVLLGGGALTWARQSERERKQLEEEEEEEEGSGRPIN